MGSALGYDVFPGFGRVGSLRGGLIRRTLLRSDLLVGAVNINTAFVFLSHDCS